MDININMETEKKDENLSNYDDNKLFIHKYQPLFLKDFEMDTELCRIFETLISIDNLNLLLIGDTACGKTSLLNSLIREYYKGNSPSKYTDNILYINNLKEQGINYYRVDVKTFCQTRSVIKDKKKIVVLDDIDFINEQSQQVFRNCIDKYSHNVHFISACNNVQKVIESLQSRFNIIKIKKITKENLHTILKKIKKHENIELDEKAEDFVINVSNNSIKTLINYMEKFKMMNQPITFELANQTCTNISFLLFEDYTQMLLTKHLTTAIKIIYNIYDKGYSVMDILDNYFLFVKHTTILNDTQKYKIIPYICKYVTIFHSIHEDEIELALFTNNLINVL
jgi:DNA polymerase III delta prime subunit